MADIFDNICRALATPMPRSRALKLIAAGLASMVVAPMAFGQRGRQTCPGGNPSGLCPAGQKCCFSTDDANYCCPGPYTCCGGSCCPPGKNCVKGVCGGSELLDPQKP